MGKYRYFYGCKFLSLIGAYGLTLGRNVFYYHKYGEVPKKIEVHESVHLSQFEKYGFFKFIFIYIKEYMFFRLSGLSHWESYYRISFEIEAFKYEKEIMAKLK